MLKIHTHTRQIILDTRVIFEHTHVLKIHTHTRQIILDTRVIL